MFIHTSFIRIGSNHSGSSRLRVSIALTLLGGLTYGVNAFSAPAAGSAYYTDPQYSHVEDATSKGIGQVNMITCIMSAMRPDALVNQGAYIALVDQSKCDPESRSSSANAGASGDGAQASNYMTATVNSARTSNSDPMRAKVWIDEEEDGHRATIFVNISASEAPTTANPYGQFRLDFCGKADEDPTSCMMQGYLQGANGSLNYYQAEQRDGNGSSTVALRLSSVGTTTGSGMLDMTRSENGSSQQQSYPFAYDSNHFLRGDQCFSRDASDPETGLSVWRYGVYNSITGARVTRNSGFPIEYTTAGQTYRGYLGYWGLSLPTAAQATLTNGATVQKVEYSNNSDPTRTDYNVIIAGGKLTKYTKKTRTLHALDQIRFTTFVNDVTGFISGATANTQYELYWDDAQSLFVVTARMDCSQNGCQTQALNTPQTVSAAFWQPRGGIQGWSQALGGEVFVDLHSISNPLVSSQVNVIYRQQDLVYPSQMPATLYCVRDCPTGAALNAYFANGSMATSPYANGTYNNWNASSSYVSYGTNAATAMLTSGGQNVSFTDKDAYQQRPQFQWGVRSGRLFTTLSDASCGSGQYCDYKVNDSDVYYMWETGPNNWNQFAAVKDAGGAFVQFDAPLQFNYTVPSGVQYGQYAGKSIVLQYGGFGDLWGIPGSCVSALTNQPISCDQDNSRYVPEFVIPYDTVLGEVSDGTNTYLVKWLDREIRFARKSAAVCSNLNLPNSMTLPTAADLKDPTNSSSDIYIGAKPTVTTAPRVIHGEVKY